MGLFHKVYAAAHKSDLFRRLYDMTHSRNPNCAGCGHKYNKFATLNFEYDRGQREINTPFVIQPQETFSATIRIHIKPEDIDPKTGYFQKEIKSVKIDKSGIIVCSTCAEEKRKDRLVEDVYAYMQTYWARGRVPDLEELMLTASISLDPNPKKII